MSMNHVNYGANFTIERGDLLAFPRIYDRGQPLRVRALAQAIHFVLFSPYSRWRYE